MSPRPGGQLWLSYQFLLSTHLLGSWLPTSESPSYSCHRAHLPPLSWTLKSRVMLLEESFFHESVMGYIHHGCIQCPMEEAQAELVSIKWQSCQWWPVTSVALTRSFLLCLISESNVQPFFSFLFSLPELVSLVCTVV